MTTIADLEKRVQKLEGDKSTKSLIHIVLDRSGSMDSIWSGVKEGFDSFIREQSEFDADVTLTYFDDEHGSAFVNLPIKKVKKLASYKEIHPRGSTALLDAVGFGIKAVEEKSDDYEKIVFVVYTDGYENHSQEYTTERVVKLIKKYRSKWQFVYLGANQDAWAVASNLGFNVNSVTTFTSTPKGASAGYANVSHGTSSYLRGQTATVDVVPDSDTVTPTP